MMNAECVHNNYAHFTLKLQRQNFYIENACTISK